MNARSDELLRQQYLIPKHSVKKLRDMSRREGVSAGELARRAIDAYTSGRVVAESADEAAARDLLADIHRVVRSRLERIDASLVELRARERSLETGGLRAQVRDETLAWLRAHPDEADAVVELFAPSARA